MNGKVFLWILPVFWVVACQPGIEAGTGGAPRVGKIVPEGEPVRIDLRSTAERIPNCSGSSSTITKNPSMTIITSHSVEWKVGGQAGVGLTIGEEVIPFGVDLSGALEGSMAEGVDQGFAQVSSWHLSAAPGEIVEYTLAWWELWQPGYIDVTMADQTITRVYVRYRSGIQSDIVAQKATHCDGEAISEATIGSTTPSSTSNETPPQTGTTIETRSDKLVLYDSIYEQRGWCDLWEQLIGDQLVSGDCPQAVHAIAREDIVTNTGQKVQLINGVQITIASDITISDPACIVYGLDAHYATLSGGRIQSWVSNTNIATDVTVLPNSIFTLYFRCDHVVWQ